jgi:hypothetical protein
VSPREEAGEDRMAAQEDVGAEMARYGITRVSADIFHYRDYRYAKFGDAVAQAKRDANAASANPK